jgi:hypothetical protein
LTEAKPTRKTKTTTTAKTTDTPVAKPKRQMSAAHKESLAQGREQSQKVARYLEALNVKKRRGRQVTVETLKARLEKARSAFDGAKVLERLKLTQQVRDIKAQIAALESTPTVDMPALEADFVAVAKSYAEAQHISRASFIENGVPKSVLVAAGI